MSTLRSRTTPRGEKNTHKDETYERALLQARFFVQLARLLSSDLSLNEILTNLFGLLRQMMSVEQIAIVQVDAYERETVHMHPPPGSASTAELDFAKRIAFSVLSARGISPASSPSEFSGAFPEAIRIAPHPERSVLTAPLVQQGNTGGVLIVQSLAPENHTTDFDQQIVTAVAQHLAIVLERERVVEIARRRADKLAAYGAITSTVNEWVDVEQIARRFLLVFLNVTSTSVGLFYLLESNHALRLIAHFGVPDDSLEPLRHTRLAHHSDAARAIEQAQPITMEEVTHAGVSRQMRGLAQLLGLQGAVILPLRAKGRGIGLVMLMRSATPIELADREFLQGLGDQAAQAIENARLFAESERRFKEQSALRELAQRFLSSVTPDQVLERTLDTLANLLPGNYAEVLLPDNGSAFSLASGRGWRRGVVGRTQISSDLHLHAGYVLRAQVPVIVENFNTETRFQPSDYLQRHQVTSGICAPMLAEMRVIGMLGIYSRRARAFTKEQAHFLYLVATQTAMALEKARHSQDAARRLDELILVNDLIVAASSDKPLDSVVSNLAGEIGELLSSRDVHIIVASNGLNQDTVPILDTPNPARSVWSARVAEWVLQNRVPLLVSDLMSDNRFNAAGENARACLAVPMMSGERVVGVIAVAHPDPNSFDSDDLRLLSTLAAQISVAIERARLLEETRKRLDEMSALFELSNAVRLATTESELLQVVVRDAVNILQGCGGSIQMFNERTDSMQVAAVLGMSHLGMSIPHHVGGLSWQVYNLGETIALSDVMNDPRVGHPEVFGDMHAAIIAPLRTPSGVSGTLFIGFHEQRVPAASQLRLATMIANLATQALQRLRLHEQTVEQASSLTRTLNELEESYQATLLALSAALDARDRETEGHSQRVTKWALAIGKQLNLSEHELTSLERGALLHDVGKIGISDNILLKAGPLTPIERARMNEHPRMGYEMLQGIDFLRDALPVVLHHQEMFDGSGYPDGLRGDEIPLGARIFAVADTYDAMTSTRPYRTALSHERALEEIKRCTGTQFDPLVVAAFLSLFKSPSDTLS